MGQATKTGWEEIPWEPLNDKLDRRMMSGERAMVTLIRLKKGCIVPLHHHENEQFSYVLEGRLRFWVGHEAEEILVRAGEVIHLPSDLPHKVEALEGSLSLDIFSPPRQDWLTGEDSYLRT